MGADILQYADIKKACRARQDSKKAAGKPPINIRPCLRQLFNNLTEFAFLKNRFILSLHFPQVNSFFALFRLFYNFGNFSNFP